MSVYDNIPLELRLMKRWCFTGREQEPDPRMCKAPHMLVDGYMKPISTTTEYDHCLTFLQIESLLPMYPDRQVGYILVDGDGYTCIDLDVKDDSPIDLTSRHAALISQLDTYTEASTSGCGAHLWFKGEIDGVIKTTEMEVYSRERFIVCTGNVMYDRPVIFDQGVIDFFNANAAKTVDYTIIEDRPQVDLDQTILKRIAASDHSGKFKALKDGDWDTYTEILSGQRNGLVDFNPSDADAAFMTIVAFFTQNFAQCKRLWRDSALADLSKRYQGDEREMKRKAKNTGTEYKLNRVINLAIQRNAADAEFRAKETADGAEKAKAIVEQLQQVAQEPENFAINGANYGIERPESLAYPPGRLGELAEYFNLISIKPVLEFGILEALAVASGLFGRSYNVSGTGLNLYMMLIAASGTGKSAIAKNPEAFFNHYRNKYGIMDAANFVTTKKFTHENSLLKEVGRKSCFVHCQTEFGKTFRNMMTGGSVNGTNALTTVRECMTDLYSKSGHNDVVGGVGYTADDKTVEINHAVSLSFLGESVAEPFYESVTPDMFSDGFMSRFLITEYTGRIVYDNVNMDAVNMPPAMESYFEEAIKAIIMSLADINNVDVMPVGRSPEAGMWLADFARKCTDTANENMNNPVVSSLWTRCNLKVMKIASLLAVADNFRMPVITMEHVTWAFDFVMRHNELVLSLVHDGRIGNDESAKHSALRGTIQAYFTAKSFPKDGYGQKNAIYKMREKGIIPGSAILQRGRSLSCFRQQKGFKGAGEEINVITREFVDSAFLRKLTKEQAQTDWKTSAVLYQIIGG